MITIDASLAMLDMSAAFLRSNPFVFPKLVLPVACVWYVGIFQGRQHTTYGYDENSYPWSFRTKLEKTVACRVSRVGFMSWAILEQSIKVMDQAAN
jgi:hypothetical protein